MFNRRVIKELEQWAADKNRKPLVLRGARQVGKTSAVDLFSRNFDQYIYLNLERREDSRFFREFDDVEDIVEAIFFMRDQQRTGKKTLLFIDEIQEETKAIEQLRYFYEKTPDLYTIAAGSLLESVLDKKINIPVGRAQYLAVRPLSFPEFLEVTGEIKALEQLTKIPVEDFAHEKLLSLFHTYVFIGGMPEAVKLYAERRDITALKPVYESLLVSYLDDVEKYARNAKQRNVIRHLIRTSFELAGKRIKFEGFGKSNYRSRETGEAFRVLEKAMVLQLVYPTTGVKIPFSSDLKKSPRLQMLDTGLFNYFSGLQPGLLGKKDLNEEFQGRVTEHIAGQELMANSLSVLNKLSFWVREKNMSSAEVDYVYPFKGLLIPLEVKSGAAGKLRSLHLFIDQAPHKMAIRFYPGKVNLQEAETLQGKKYFLLNLPYYSISQIDKYLDWFEEKIKVKKRTKKK